MESTPKTGHYERRNDDTSFCHFCDVPLPEKLCPGLSTERRNEDKEGIQMGGHYWSKFVLTGMLQVSEEKCSEFLSRGGPVDGAHLWFNLCRSCNELVGELYGTLEEVKRLETRVATIRAGVKRLVFATCGGGAVRQFGGRSPLYSVIREHVISESSSLIPGVAQATLEKISVPTTSHPIFSFMVEGEDDYGSQPPTNDDPLSMTPKDGFSDEFASTGFTTRPSGSDVSEAGNQEWKRAPHNTKAVSLMLKNKVKTSEKQSRGPYKKKVPGCCGPAKRIRDRNTFKCVKCPARFRTSAHLTDHDMLHAETERCGRRGRGVRCHTCGWLCLKKKLDSHLYRRHGVGEKQLKRRKKEEIPVYCNHCALIFTNKGQLRNHWGRVHSFNEMQSCSWCEAKFETQQLLELHAEEKHPNQFLELGAVGEQAQPMEETLQCTHCPLTFPSRMKLDFHKAKEHKGQLLICSECGKGDFGKPGDTGYKNYQRHLKSHSKVKEKEFSCELCAKLFTNKTYLGMHKRLEHCQELGLEEIRCDKCGVLFPCTAQLSLHMKEIHERAITCNCEFCGKGFRRLVDLKRHTQLHHSGTRDGVYKKGPFFCEHCQAKFNVRQALYYHLKRMHSDKYLHRCEHCGKGYCSLNAVNLHKKSCKKAKNVDQALVNWVDGESGETQSIVTHL